MLTDSLILVVVWRRVHPKWLKKICTLTLKNFNKTTTPVRTPWIAPMKQVRDAWEISCWNTVFLHCAHSWGKGRQNWNAWKVYNGYVTRKCGFFFRTGLCYKTDALGSVHGLQLWHGNVFPCVFGVAEEIAENGLGKANSFLRAKILVASKWGQSSFSIKLDAAIDLRMPE